jgi:pimeloyl-ACP methyl ester carboxylesterase
VGGRYAQRRLSVPTRFMIGERDALGTDCIEELLRSNADRIDVEVVPGAGHFLLEERPALVEERVLEFLAGGGPTTAPTAYGGEWNLF